MWWKLPKTKLILFIPVIIIACGVGGGSDDSDTSVKEYWRGLEIAPEHRCSPYNQEDYRYPQSLEPKIFELIGTIYCPYTGQCFASLSDTDIEHILARSEAHDSGLCAADLDTRERFASDLDNLTLADPYVNRYRKRNIMMPRNGCLI